MSVRIVAGEEGLLAAGGAEEGAADAAEGEGADGIGLWCRSVLEGPLELGYALAEGGVGEVQKPADFPAGVAGEGEQCCEAEAWRQVG